MQRCNEGRAKAKAEGVVFGRKPLDAGETTCDVALSFNVSHTTISQLKPRTLVA